MMLRIENFTFFQIQTISQLLTPSQTFFPSHNQNRSCFHQSVNNLFSRFSKSSKSLNYIEIHRHPRLFILSNKKCLFTLYLLTTSSFLNEKHLFTLDLQTTSSFLNHHLFSFRCVNNLFSIILKSPSFLFILDICKHNSFPNGDMSINCLQPDF